MRTPSISFLLLSLAAWLSLVSESLCLNCQDGKHEIDEPRGLVSDHVRPVLVPR